MSPKIAVDAPTLYESGLNTHENIIPPKDEVKYRVQSFQQPRPFSRPEPITTVESTFSVKWTKLACKKVGVMNLQTYPLFLILRASFQPSTSRALGLGARNSVFTMR